MFYPYLFYCPLKVFNICMRKYFSVSEKYESADGNQLILDIIDSL